VRTIIYVERTIMINYYPKIINNSGNPSISILNIIYIYIYIVIQFALMQLVALILRVTCDVYCNYLYPRINVIFQHKQSE